MNRHLRHKKIRYGDGSLYCLKCTQWIIPRHQHFFAVERGVGDKKGYIKYFDMACECGLKMFVQNPSIHRGDEPERKIKFNEEL